jgi:hypothetical protein
MGAGQTELAAPALADDVASTDSGPSPATKSRRVQKPRHRGTKAEEAREIERLVRYVRARRIVIDEAHDILDSELADEARHLGDAGQRGGHEHPPAEKLPNFGSTIKGVDDHRDIELTDFDSQSQIFVRILGMGNDDRHPGGRPAPASGRQSSTVTEAARAATAHSRPEPDNGPAPRTDAGRKPAVPVGDQLGEGSSRPAAWGEPTAELQWPTQRYRECTEAILGKKFAVDKFLRDVWKPFIKRYNVVVTRRVIEEVDPGIAGPLRNGLARNPSLLQEVGILTDRQARKMLASRPVSAQASGNRIAVSEL